MSDRTENPLIEEALRWLVVLRDEQANDSDRRAFERWRQTDPAHEAAWTRAQAVWAKADLLQPAFDRGEQIVVPFKAAVPQPRSGRRRWLIAAGIVAVAGPAAFVASRPGLWSDYRTSPGERRTVTLTDGSVVELGGASALSVSFNGATRRLQLEAGEAFFTVAADTARPFIVEAGQGRTRALGTAFNVKRIDDSVAVAVAEHRVEVSTDSGGKIDLEQGQQVRYTAGRLQEPHPADLRTIEGWRRDRLVFQDAPLGEVVADLERCRGGRIVFTDSALRALPVTAVFDTKQADAALSTIAAILPIKLHRLTDWLVVLSPKG